MMLAELQATCSSLGYQEKNSYVKEPDCTETVKDLIRFLKREDDTCDIRRQLGHAQIVQNDLVHILKGYADDSALFDTVIRLLVNLTQPAYLCFDNLIPEDKTLRNYYLEIESHLLSYKLAFADESLFAVLTKKLGDLLQLDFEQRSDDDSLVIERVLILVRNILHVPPDVSSEKRTDDDATIHDQVLWALHTSGMEDLLLYVASSDSERQFCMHCLEVISLMFREQTPEQLASAGGQRSMTEKQKDEQELLLAMEKEKSRKQANMMKYSTRHSRFGGTYVCQKIKSISDENLIYHRSLGDACNISHDMGKNPTKKPKNRKPIKEIELTRRSTLSIRLFLKEFCVQFLENCYNPLMYAVKDNILHNRSQENDETYYLWALRFFMEFNRHYKFKLALVGETMSLPTFHYMQTELMRYHEMILGEKKEAIVWSKRLHLALRAYRELLLTLHCMDKSKDEQICRSSKVMKNNIFYMMEYRDIFLVLLRKFNESKNSRSLLKDLIETCHIYIKMLEQFAKGGSCMVQKKKRTANKKKNKKASKKDNSGPSKEELEELWDGLSDTLSEIIQGKENIPESTCPFDVTSDIEDTQQRVNAMIRIQDDLRGNKPADALALFRAAREVWPEENQFGEVDIPPEDEFMALREVFFAEIQRPQAEQEDNAFMEDEGNEPDEVVEEELEDAMPSYSEQEFNMQEFIVSFASPLVLKPYALLFSEFKINSVFTNHCIIRLFHRLAVDLHIPGVLFQAAIFRTFQKILSYRNSEIYKELYKFAIYVTKKFFESAKDNEKIFMELMFWKSKRDAIEVSEGYGSYKENHESQKQSKWNEEQIEELKTLFEQLKDVDGELDAADYILAHVIDNTRTRRQIIRQLVQQDLIENAAALKRKGPTRPTRLWREEEELELKNLFDQFKDTDDVVANIINNMKTKRSKPKVMEKIMALELVEDKKELYKKRKRKNGGQNRNETEGFVDDQDDESAMASESENEAENEPEVDSSQSEDDSVTPNHQTEDTGSSFKNLLDKLKNQGLEDQIKWIQNNLRRTADELEEDDDDEPIPIVPLTEDHENAMENKNFKTFLKTLGIAPPANEQERFWRIPAKLKADKLRKLVDCIDDPNSSDAPVIQGQGHMKTKSKRNNARFEMLKNLAKQKKDNQATKDNNKRFEENPDNSNSEDDEVPLVKKTPIVTKRLRKTDTSSDSDVAGPSNEPKEKSKPSKRAKLDSESSSNMSSRPSSDEEGLGLHLPKPTGKTNLDTSSSSSSDDDELHISIEVSNKANKKSTRLESSSSEDELLPKASIGNAADNRDSFADTSKADQEMKSDSDDQLLPMRKAVKRPTIASDSE